MRRKIMPDGSIAAETLSKGYHYVEIALNEVPMFITERVKLFSWPSRRKPLKESPGMIWRFWDIREPIISFIKTDRLRTLMIYYIYNNLDFYFWA